jgi:hypothetical protein
MGSHYFSSGSPQKGELKKIKIKTPMAQSSISIAIHVRFQQFF